MRFLFHFVSNWVATVNAGLATGVSKMTCDIWIQALLQDRLPVNIAKQSFIIFYLHIKKIAQTIFDYGFSSKVWWSLISSIIFLKNQLSKRKKHNSDCILRQTLS